MSAWYLLIIGVPILTLAQTTGSAFLPPPWSTADPTLILAVGLVANFRNRQALAVAVISGFILDILLAAPPGAEIFARTTAILATILAFNLIFTNLSYLSFAALNALTYLASRLIFTLIGLAAGWPGILRLADQAWTDWLGWFAADLAVQLAAALVLMFLARRTGRFFLNRFRRAT
ncbi:MAG: hypothetical protein WCT10_01720 [Patescibacteria group bacterium]|jgi:hypothetical protein